MLDTEHKIDEQEDTASAAGSPHLSSGTPAKRETAAGGNSTPHFSNSEDILDGLQRRNSKTFKVSIIFLSGKYFS